MTGRKHRSNMELMAQGLAKRGIRSSRRYQRHRNDSADGYQHPRRRAQSPGGHDARGIVLLFIVAAGPLVSFIPLSALAGVLVVVCWNMAEKDEVWRLLRQWGTGTVFAATFAVTALKDLTLGSSWGAWWPPRSLSRIARFQKRARSKYPPYELDWSPEAPTIPHEAGGRRPYLDRLCSL